MASSMWHQKDEPKEEDLIPIQNFMRRFSHNDPRDYEPTSEELREAAEAEAAKHPTRLQKFKRFFERPPPPPPPREPTRHDWLLLPLMKTKDWLVDHPKITALLCTILLSNVAPLLPYYSIYHEWACWCIEDEACAVGWILRRGKFLILCL